MGAELQCDVAVVGAGISGMITAIRAAQGGRRALVLEKLPDERYVCNSRLTAGIWHCCLTDVLSDPELLERRIHEVSGSTARPDLARAVARDAVRAVRWMQQLGIRFIKGPYDYQSFMLSPPTITPQGRQWEGRGGDVMLRTFEAELGKLGGRILRGYRATELLQSAGRVTGLAGEGPGGARFQISASSVVIADGGFQANDSLTRGPISPHPERVFQRNARTGVGDGLRMALAAGAGTSDLSGFYGHVLSRDAFHTDKLWPYAWLDYVLAAGVIVDGSGRRFTDEGAGGVAVANAIAASADPSDKLVIADERIWQERGTFGLLPPNPRLPQAGGTMHRADSIEALARLCGIEPATLSDEIARYNGAVKSEQLTGLSPGRSAGKFLPYPIEAAPFYAFPACAGITYTMGGILINASGQVLSPSEDVIPGLYAVGCATGGLEGGAKAGYVGGLVKSSVTALRAGEHICGELAALA